jgi:hypothetical protein
MLHPSSFSLPLLTSPPPTPPLFLSSHSQIKTVLQWVEKLISRRGGNKVLTTDIGIVTPYVKQVQRFRQQLSAKYPGIKVCVCVCVCVRAWGERVVRVCLRGGRVNDACNARRE